MDQLQETTSRRSAAQSTKTIALLLMALGIAACACQYFSRRSFWHDEAYLIFNLWAKSPRELLGHLNVRPHQPQAAPPIFLWIEKGLLQWRGTSELPLRLPAFVLAVLSILLFWRIAWIVLAEWAAAGAVGLFALSDHLILHAAEVKPYSGDVFFACLLIWLALEGKGRRLSIGRAALLAFVAAVGVWWSYPVVFVFGGIVMSLFLGDWQTGRTGWFQFVLLLAPVTISLALLQQMCLRHQLDPLFYQMWKPNMIDLRRPWQIVSQTYDLVSYLATWAAPLVFILAICGSWPLGEQPQMLALLCGPIVFTAAAAMLHKYPYGGSRAAMFLLPHICLLAGFGFAWLAGVNPSTGLEKTPHPNPLPGYRERGKMRILGWIMMAGANVILIGGVVYYMVQPRTRSHVRPAIEFVQRHREPGDRIFVIGVTTSEDYAVYVPERDNLTMLQCTPQQDVSPGRVWLIFAGPESIIDHEMRDALKHDDPQRVATKYRYHGGAAVLLGATVDHSKRAGSGRKRSTRISATTQSASRPVNKSSLELG